MIKNVTSNLSNYFLLKLLLVNAKMQNKRNYKDTSTDFKETLSYI